MAMRGKSIKSVESFVTMVVTKNVKNSEKLTSG